MKIKFFEVRDRMTLIPVMVIKLSSQKIPVGRLLERAGIDPDQDYPTYLVVKLTEGISNYFCYDWEKNKGRTMFEFHQHIQENFDQYEKECNLVDIEYVLGESNKEKEPEI